MAESQKRKLRSGNSISVMGEWPLKPLLGGSLKLHLDKKSKGNKWERYDVIADGNCGFNAFSSIAENKIKGLTRSMVKYCVLRFITFCIDEPEIIAYWNRKIESFDRSTGQNCKIEEQIDLLSFDTHNVHMDENHMEIISYIFKTKFFLVTKMPTNEGNPYITIETPDSTLDGEKDSTLDGDKGSTLDRDKGIYLLHYTKNSCGHFDILHNKYYTFVGVDKIPTGIDICKAVDKFLSHKRTKLQCKDTLFRYLVLPDDEIISFMDKKPLSDKDISTVLENSLTDSQLHKYYNFNKNTTTETPKFEFEFEDNVEFFIKGSRDREIDDVCGMIQSIPRNRRCISRDQEIRVNLDTIELEKLKKILVNVYENAKNILSNEKFVEPDKNMDFLILGDGYTLIHSTSYSFYEQLEGNVIFYSFPCDCDVKIHEKWEDKTQLKECLETAKKTKVGRVICLEPGDQMVIPPWIYSFVQAEHCENSVGVRTEVGFTKTRKKKKKTKKKRQKQNDKSINKKVRHDTKNGGFIIRRTYNKSYETGRFCLQLALSSLISSIGISVDMEYLKTLSLRETNQREQISFAQNILSPLGFCLEPKPMCIDIFMSDAIYLVRIRHYENNAYQEYDYHFVTMKVDTKKCCFEIEDQKDCVYCTKEEWESLHKGKSNGITMIRSMLKELYQDDELIIQICDVTWKFKQKSQKELSCTRTLPAKKGGLELTVLNEKGGKYSLCIQIAKHFVVVKYDACKRKLHKIGCLQSIDIKDDLEPKDAKKYIRDACSLKNEKNTKILLLKYWKE